MRLPYPQTALVILLVLIAVSLPSACAEEEIERTEAETATAGTQTQAETVAETGEREPTIASITQDMEKLRGLPLKSQLDIAYIDREELGKELAVELEEEYPVEEVAAEEKVLKGLGLIEEDMDLLALLEDLLGEGILGYYDDETKELRIVSETEVIDPLNEITLAHEITHALQDQAFNLQALLPTEGSGNDDRDLAVLSLIEGDATISEEEYAVFRMNLSDALNLLMTSLGAPLGWGSSYVDDSLTFPYLQGRQFVDYIKRDGGWQAVNNVYGRPPESTEQVMHPEKYQAGERPVEVKIPDLPASLGGGWNLVYDNVMGEFDALEAVKAGSSSSQAARAAAGWGGGRIQYYEDAAGRALIVMVLNWDSQAEADEFSLAMAASLEERTGSVFVFEQGSMPYLEAGYETWVLAQRGSNTVVASAPDAGTASRAGALILGL